MIKLVSIQTNLSQVTVGSLSIWFSYETPVAFVFKGDFHISENVWSNTSDKHLTVIHPNKSIRENHDILEGNLATAISDLFNKEDSNEYPI